MEVKIIPTANIKAAISGNAPACIGDTLTLVASAGFSEYLWSNGGDVVSEDGKEKISANDFYLDLEDMKDIDDKEIIN